VYFGGRVGFASTLKGALDEAFQGAQTGGTSTGTTPPGSSTTTPPNTTTTPPPTNGGGANPALDQAVADMGKALADLKAAQQSGDFAKQGEALAALEKAITAYNNAKGGSGGG